MSNKRRPRSSIAIFLRHAGFWFFFLIFVFGLSSLIVGQLATEASEFDDRGVETTATVVRIFLDKPTSLRPAEQQYEIPMATVRFTVRGTDRLSRDQISEDLFESLQPDDEITIRYLPEDPLKIEIARGSTFTEALTLGAVPVLSLTLWLFVVIRAILYTSEALKVRKQGTPREVTVESHHAPVFTSDKKPQTRLAWVDSSGQRNLSLPLKMELAKLFPEGRTITIYELPGSRSFWELDLFKPDKE